MTRDIVPLGGSMLAGLPGVDEFFGIKDYVPGQPIPDLIRDPKTGKVVVNELKRYIKPFWLTMEPEVLTLGGNGVSDPTPMMLDNKGGYEIFQAFFTSSQAAGFTVEFMMPDNRNKLMNREVHVATIASGGGVTTPVGTFPSTSSAGRPFRWPESYFLDVEDKGKAIMCVFRNLSASSNTIRLVLHGLRWYHTQAPAWIASRMKHLYRERLTTFPFFYTTEEFVNLSALGTQDVDIRFTDEGYVDWVKSMAFADGAFDVRIREKENGRRFMENPIRDSLVFGNGEFPFLNWESSLFEPNYKTTFELTDVSNAPNKIWITLGCRKLLWDPHDDRLAPPEAAGGIF